MRFVGRVLVVALVLAACGGGNAPDRASVKECLDAAGLAPEDTGLFILGSGGTDVEALGVRLPAAGRVLLFVFEEDAASEVGNITDNFAADAADVEAIGNVVIAYETDPSPDERAQVEECVT